MDMWNVTSGLMPRSIVTKQWDCNEDVVWFGIEKMEKRIIWCHAAQDFLYV